MALQRGWVRVLHLMQLMKCAGLVQVVEIDRKCSKRHGNPNAQLKHSDGERSLRKGGLILSWTLLAGCGMWYRGSDYGKSRREGRRTTIASSSGDGGCRFKPNAAELDLDKPQH